ncbi:hypothetical protein CVT24_009779 [Panaeolus cyanescens]|uniref:TatD DNase family Scn1 n=1 Tax=Panaeolus cyanescens TaxID=181874 RepID=A0A409VE61_9AGAR|nr:hypothetical protein CVT24_009779 [Panaeolus cyanescens]
MTNDLPPKTVLQHVVDVHCHPTDAPEGVSASAMEELSITICAMSSMTSDQSKVKRLALDHPTKVVPAFGYHPWFSHLISLSENVDKEDHYRSLLLPQSSKDASLEAEFEKLLPHLPEPRPLKDVIAEVRANLTDIPRAFIGEVGLDRSFRVPYDYHATPRELTSFSIPLQHQLVILEAQLDLAVELERNVSIHSVKSQQATVDLLQRMKQKVGEEKFLRISLDLHSCGLSAQTWRDVEKRHPNVFLSLSCVINHKHSNHRDLIAMCSEDRILVESDYNTVNMCTPQTWEMVKIVSEVRGWPLETEWDESLDAEEDKNRWGAVRRLERNWFRFRDGHHKVPVKKNKKQRNQEKQYYYESGEDT